MLKEGYTLFYRQKKFHTAEKWNFCLPIVSRLSIRCLTRNDMLQRRQDLRKGFRRPARRAAEVFFGAHEPAVRCVIWDISDGGARLAVARPLADLPPTFTLVLSKDTPPRNCQVVWTDARYVGVKFI
jgi:hypothetical protein